MDILGYAAIPLQYLGISTAARYAAPEKPIEHVVLPLTKGRNIPEITYGLHILGEARSRGGIWLYTNFRSAQHIGVQMDRRFVDLETHMLHSHLLNEGGVDEQQFRLYYRKLEGLEPDDRPDVHEEKRLIRRSLSYHWLSKLGFKNEIRIEGDNVLYTAFPHLAIPATQKHLAESTGLEALLEGTEAGIRVQNRNLAARLVEAVELYNHDGVMKDRIRIQDIPSRKKEIYAPEGGHLKVIPAQQNGVLRYHTNGTARLQQGAGSLYSEFLIFSYQYRGAPVEKPSSASAALNSFFEMISSNFQTRLLSQIPPVQISRELLNADGDSISHPEEITLAGTDFRSAIISQAEALLNHPLTLNSQAGSSSGDSSRFLRGIPPVEVHTKDGNPMPIRLAHEISFVEPDFPEDVSREPSRNTASIS